MSSVQIFVFTKIETTGNSEKIVQLSMVAVNKRYVEITEATGVMEDSAGTAMDADDDDALMCRKLNMTFNPGCNISVEETASHGITNEKVRSLLSFKDSVVEIVDFLNKLPKNFCLIACGGGLFDNKILRRELREAGKLSIEIDKKWRCKYFHDKDFIEMFNRNSDTTDTELIPLYNKLFNESISIELPIDAKKKTYMMLKCAVLKKMTFLETFYKRRVRRNQGLPMKKKQQRKIGTLRDKKRSGSKKKISDTLETTSKNSQSQKEQ